MPTVAHASSARVIWLWLRLDVRRRWPAMAVLALLIAVSTGTVLTAVAGARRGDSALARLSARTLPATVDVAPLGPGFDWGPVRNLPEVEALATYVDTDFLVEGIPRGNLSVGPPPADRELMRTLERPVVLRGRLADPARVDEVVVTPRFVSTYGKGVGDTLVAVLPTPEQSQSTLTIADAQPSGPRIQMRIVGVIRSPWFADGPQSRGSLIPTSALLSTYQPNLLNSSTWMNALIRLRGGEAAVPEFRKHLEAVTGRSDMWVRDLPEQLRHRQQAAAFEARWLLAFGVTALLAALVLLGQTLSRYVSAGLVGLDALRACGMTRGQLMAATVTGPILAAAFGSAGGVAAAVIASRWFPIGSAAGDEPSPGVAVDGLVLGCGAAAAILLVAADAAVSTWLTSGPVARIGARRSLIAVAASATRLPVPVVVGTRFALEAASESGSRRAAAPVRPALLGAVAGVTGVVAAFTFSAGVSEAAGNPARFGQTWQLEAWMGYSGQDFIPPGILRTAGQDPDVAAVNDWRGAVGTETVRRVSILVYTYSPVGRPIPVVLTAGHLPRQSGDIVLAPETASELHARAGGAVTVAGTTRHPRTLTVTGIGFVPAGSHCAGCSSASGGWVTDAGFDALFTTFQFHGGFVAVRPGVSAAAVAARLQHLAPGLGDQDLFAAPYPPFAAKELRRVQAFPLALGAFLALLAVAAVGHALASVARRRRHDLAVMRALGMTTRQSRLVLITQAGVLALVGLAFGVPLGVALGRTVWRVVADFTPLFYVPPSAGWTLVLVGPLALLVAAGLAGWPGHRVARMRIAHVLRAE